MRNSILFLVLLCCLKGAAQEGHSTSIRFDSLRGHAIKLVNEYFSMLNSLKDKPPGAADSLALLFSPGATIETSSLHRPRIERYSVSEYVERLESLHYSAHNSYRRIKFNYEPLNTKIRQVSCVDNSCVVDLPVKQSFVSDADDPVDGYADSTGKLIRMHFYYQGGILKGKIDLIAATRPTAYHPEPEGNVDSSLVSDKTASSYKKLDQRLSSLEKRMEGIANTTDALRQSINPLKPEEVLTIARLQDEVKNIDKNLADLKESIVNKQVAFEESVHRETSTSSQAITLVIVVLIPLVLNLLYTIWKDIKEGNKKRAHSSE